MNDCIFCRIVAGEIPSKRVHEDERYFAFEDINPQAPVHILIVPRAHVSGLNDVTTEHEKLVGGVHVLARQLAKQKGLADRGYRVVVNSGPEAGQSVFHLHFHLLGGRTMAWPPG
jgi:histidine triad (HIT) family protein